MFKKFYIELHLNEKFHDKKDWIGKSRKETRKHMYTCAVYRTPEKMYGVFPPFVPNSFLFCTLNYTYYYPHDVLYHFLFNFHYLFFFQIVIFGFHVHIPS